MRWRTKLYVRECVRVCVCLYVRETCETACVKRAAKVRVTKYRSWGSFFFFFNLFVSRSLSLGGAQWTADILLLISIPPLATSLVFNIGTSGAQLSFVAYSSSQRVWFFFLLHRPTFFVGHAVCWKFYTVYSLLVLNLDLRWKPETSVNGNGKYRNQKRESIFLAFHDKKKKKGNEVHFFLHLLSRLSLSGV